MFYIDEIEKVWHKSLILTICFEKPYTMDDKRAIVESLSSSSYELNTICSYAKTGSISWCIIIGCMRCLKLVYRYSRVRMGTFNSSVVSENNQQLRDKIRNIVHFEPFTLLLYAKHANMCLELVKILTNYYLFTTKPLPQQQRTYTNQCTF